MAFAVEFGLNSAKITNRYLPATVGDWTIRLGAGNWAGKFSYLNVVGIEEVSGAQIGAQTLNNVKCLKVNLIETDLTESDGLITLWIAQDTQGNVWILKIYDFFDDKTYTLGTVFKSMVMPAVPDVGDPAGITIPETTTDYCRVQAVDISIDTNFESYDNCIKTHCFHKSSTDVEYYCPDVGVVGIVRDFTEGNPKDVMDLKEYGTVTVTRAVVIPVGD